MAIYMTYPMWLEELHGLFGRNVIIDSLDELLGEGLISRDKHKMYGKDTYKYLLNYKELNLRIKLLPQGKAFTNKRDETSETVTNQSDAFTCKPDSRLQVNEDAFTKGRNIESNIESINIDSERKNDEPEQNPTVSTQDESFSHSSTQPSISLDLLPEVRQTYDLICQELYPNCHPNLTTKAVEHFTKLSSSIKTVEDIKSLVAYCRQEQPVLNTSKIHPGNLVRWLDGWLQAKPPVTEPLPELPSDPVVTDEELADDVWKFVQVYQDEEHFEEYLERVKAMRREAELSNYKMSDKMANACRRAPSSRCGIDDFFEQLRQDLYW
ncbi:MAG TPA: hypothetical protein VHV10_15550 [Ktedonobacteraceae bacterium]|nr:hypothetical protein [Ktedonobacteraceae bacterium]